MKTIYLAGGCFWGTQKFFDQFRGVTATQVGYANGPDRQPSYEEVCRSSGHAETVRVEYDEGIMSLTELLEAYFMVIDPLSVNRQGEDRGIQYRTGIYYTSPDQLPVSAWGSTFNPSFSSGAMSRSSRAVSEKVCVNL